MTPSHSVSWLDVGLLASGNPLRLALHTMTGSPGPTAAVVATVHGDEPIAIEVVRRVLHRLKSEALQGTVLAVPVMNPLAFEAYTRHTWIDMMNLNRVFPGRSTGSVSEQLAHVLQAEVLSNADAVIDLHTGSFQFVCDYSYAIGSPSFARYFGSSAVIPRTAISGSSAQQLVSRGKDAVIAEFGGGMYRDEAFIERAVEGTMNSLRALAMLPGEATIPATQIVSERMELLRPRHGGFLVPGVTPEALGTVVGKGTVLGHIISPYTFEELETFRAPFSRSLVTLVASPYVRIHPGDFAYMIVDAGSL